MNSRCPHCQTWSPKKAAYCHACGRCLGVPMDTVINTPQAQHPPRGVWYTLATIGGAATCLSVGAWVEHPPTAWGFTVVGAALLVAKLAESIPIVVNGWRARSQDSPVDSPPIEFWAQGDDGPHAKLSPFGDDIRLLHLARVARRLDRGLRLNRHHMCRVHLWSDHPLDEHLTDDQFRAVVGGLINQNLAHRRGHHHPLKLTLGGERLLRLALRHYEK